MESNTQPRDYDKDPIVIEDYNPMFNILFIIYISIYFIYLFILNLKNTHNTGTHIFWFSFFTYYILFPTITFYLYIRRNKRKIVLENNAITYRENQNIIEQIDINQINNIKRTFNDYYRKEQNIDPDHIFRILINRVLSLAKYIVLILNKLVFHIFKNRLSAYKFYDSILVITNENKIINILPTNHIEYENVCKYFLQRKSIDILSTPIIIKFDYRQEEKVK